MVNRLISTSEDGFSTRNPRERVMCITKEKNMEYKNMEYKNLEFDRVDSTDAPDIRHAFVCYAEHNARTPL